MQLDDDIAVAMEKDGSASSAVHKQLPGLRLRLLRLAHLPHVRRGYRPRLLPGEMDCIHKMRERLKVMAQQMVELAQTKRE